MKPYFEIYGVKIAFLQMFFSILGQIPILYLRTFALEPRISPYQILSFLLLVLIILLIPTFFAPSDASWPIRYPTAQHVAELLNPPPIQPSILPADTLLPAANSLAPPPADTTAALTSDTLQHPAQPAPTQPAPRRQSGGVALELADNPQALNAFLSALVRGEHLRQPVGVLHYADSQAEGDLISSTIRDVLQAKFGGRGIGLVHPGNKAQNLIGQRCSAGWSFSSVQSGTPNARNYGVLGALSSLNHATDAQWVRFSAREVKRSGTQFNRLRLLVGHNNSPYSAICTIDGRSTDSVQVMPGKALTALQFDIPQNTSTTELRLLGEGPIHAYGLLQESERGVFVHNIPIRGSSGTFFSKLNEQLASELMEELNVRLIVVQYGINAVPTSATNYKFYENTMTAQLKALKRIRPDASIVLVGVSDMSVKTANGYASHPNVVRVRAAQRQAARRAGVAFWDCYMAMGGDNSMSTWALGSPQLGQKDFTHFTPRGARRIGRMLANALLDAHERFHP